MFYVLKLILNFFNQFQNNYSTAYFALCLSALFTLLHIRYSLLKYLSLITNISGVYNIMYIYLVWFRQLSIDKYSMSSYLTKVKYMVVLSFFFCCMNNTLFSEAISVDSFGKKMIEHMRDLNTGLFIIILNI